MKQTQDFENTLDLDNVVAVEYDEAEDRVVVFVTEKKDEADLDPDQLVAANVDEETDVVEVGELSVQEMSPASGERQRRVRPVPAGVSEMNSNGTAGTSGPYPAIVRDTSKGKWDDDVETGTRVRLSNAHVYAPVGVGRLGQRILQPGPHDGGDPSDEVGRLVGYVPIEDGMTVDAAARTVTDDAPANYGLGDDYGTDVYRDDFALLKGRTAVKTGRTTGVTRGEILATSATARIDYGKEEPIKVRDLVFAEAMSEGGDSGSPMFLDDTGELVGELFAGGPRMSAFYKMTNVERELGVEIMTEDTTDDSYVKSLDVTVDVEMEERDLDLVNFSGDKPKAGETITATATVEGNYPGNAYLDVQGEKYEFALDDDNRAEVEVDVTAPDEYAETFELDIDGGYVL